MPIFDASSLHTAVRDTLAASDIGEDTNAFVAVVVRDAEGNVVVKGVLATKLSETWTIAGALDIEHKTRISGGIAVMRTWR